MAFPAAQRLVHPPCQVTVWTETDLPQSRFGIAFPLPARFEGVTVRDLVSKGLRQVVAARTAIQ